MRAFARRIGLPFWRDLVKAALLGGLIAAGQAPLGLWAVALPALGGLIWLISDEQRAQATWLGWFGGAGYFAAAMFWIVDPFMVDAAKDGWMAPFALVFLAFGMALFWALAAWMAGFAAPKRRALALAVALAAVELGRSYVFTGLPWALIGHIWIDTRLAQLASLVGPVGLTLLTTLAAAVPLAGLVRSRRAVWVSGAGVVAVLGAGAVWGQWRLAAPEIARPVPITVRLVQPNVPQDQKWRDDLAAGFFQRQLAFTAAVADPMPDVVIWPETAVPYLLGQSDQVLQLVAEAAGGKPVILGINREEGGRYYNSLVVTGPQGDVTATYDKHHLVPFGEYIPFGDYLADFGITGFATRDGNGFSKGPGAAVLDLGMIGKVLPLICYEAVFPQDLRTDQRPDWIVQITNDAWFGEASGPYQHLAQARLRAIEQGLPLIRAANTGVSAVIDAKGRVVKSLPLGVAAYLDAPLPPALPLTLYSRTGDLPMAVLLGILAIGLALFRRRNTG